MTPVEIVASASTVKEIVSRVLAELEAMGAIHRGCGHIVKPERENLPALPNGDGTADAFEGIIRGEIHEP